MPSYQESASNSLSITQSAVQTVRRNLLVVNSFDVFQIIDNNFRLQSVEDTLVLAQLLSTNKIDSQSLGDPIILTQDAFVISAKNNTVSNNLSFTQLVIADLISGIANNNLELTQNVSFAGPISASASNDITFPIEDFDGEPTTEIPDLQGLRDSVTFNNTYNISVTSVLQLAHFGARNILESVSNHIHLSDLAESVEYESVTSVLQLTQTVTDNIVKSAESVLTLTQTIDPDYIRNISLTSNLNLSQVVTFYRLADLCQYDPGVGDIDPAPSMIDPVLVERSTVIFSYPYPISTTTLEVRNPIFDDNHQLEFRKINRKTRGGTLKIFRDSIWPESERLIWSFDNLTEAKKKEILAFLELSIGKEIGILDFYNRQWRGIILTPTTQIGNEDRPGNSVTIEFEGEIDSGGLSAEIESNVNINNDLTEIPPGFQTAIGLSGELVSNVARE
jgi:hypothetical protein